MKRAVRAILASTLLLSGVAYSGGEAHAIQYDYQNSRNIYEDIYFCEYVPLYRAYHGAFQKLTATAEEDSELAVFLENVWEQYNAFFGLRREAGGTEGMSRYDIPTAIQTMNQQQSDKDYAGAHKSCEEVLLPLLFNRIEFLQGQLSRLQGFEGSPYGEGILVVRDSGEDQRDIDESCLAGNVP